MQIAPRAEQQAARIAAALARGLAYAGGAILIALAVLTVASILGRAINAWGFGAIAGDYELVEAGIAVAVFAFLPWCQLERGHVTVDIVADGLGRRGREALTLVGNMALAALAFLIVWRLYLGFGEKFPYFSEASRDRLGMGFKPFFPETTFELELPIWVPFGLSLIGAAAFLIVALYTVWRDWNALFAAGEP
ncbi:MAG: TRAP transporter small permease [Pseudomonadota bacterium]